MGPGSDGIAELVHSADRRPTLPISPGTRMPAILGIGPSVAVRVAGGQERRRGCPSRVLLVR